MVKTVVITGGPSTGKTTLINSFAKDYEVLPEAARWVLTHHPQFSGKNAISARGLRFQRAIWQLQLSHYQQFIRSTKPWVFLDRGIPDSFAYLRLTRSYFPKDLREAVAAVHYDWVFILDELPSYTQDSQRTETLDEARRIGALIRHYYQRCGYEPIPVKFESVENRKMFILNMIKPL